MEKSAVISFSELDVQLQDIFDAMGYRGALPDEQTITATEKMLDNLQGRLTPAYYFRIYPGSAGKTSVNINGIELETAGSITKILKGSEQFAVFIVTAGSEYEVWAEEVRQGGDIMEQFISDAIGSATAVKMGQYMEKQLDETLKGANHSSNFSPGHCSWDISDQVNLFKLLGENTCGVSLTDSFLMHPIKSVSGIVGIGETVKPKVNSCMLCPLVNCFRRTTITH